MSKQDPKKQVWLSCSQEYFQERYKLLSSFVNSRSDFEIAPKDTSSVDIVVLEEYQEDILTNVPTHDQLFILTERPKEVVEEDIIFEPSEKDLIQRLKLIFASKKKRQRKKNDDGTLSSNNQSNRFSSSNVQQGSRKKKYEESKVLTEQTEEQKKETKKQIEQSEEQTEHLEVQSKEQHKDTSVQSEYPKTKTEQNKRKQSIEHEHSKQSVHDENEQSIDDVNQTSDEYKSLTSEDINALIAQSQSVQKRILRHSFRDTNQTIGVWSPLHRMGVTTFCINFALALAEQRILTGVLELPSENHNLKIELKRIANEPHNWRSYASFIHDFHTPTAEPLTDLPFEWIYQGVSWYPLGKDDTHDITWYYETMQSYITNLNVLDVTLIDMPSGNMDEPIKWALEQLDECWILVDDNYQSISAYRNYIHKLFQDYPHIEVKLIFNKHFPSFSRPNELSEELDYPLLTCIHDLHEAVLKNQYQHKPLINMPNYRQTLLDGYKPIIEHVTGSQYNTVNWIERMKSTLLSPFYKRKKSLR
ncbi:hypothetical protein ACTWQB_16430 [Piscibacillus sp. B03]|uniref:hypothetical protein n=1 Tax=Piscibacillus sp. B03 TaxID=3457430 RepID=UPI003FCDFD03